MGAFLGRFPMDSGWYLAWWNLVFILPFLLALLYLILYSMSGLTFGEAGAAAPEADADMDAGAEVDADADADLDADADADAGVETGAAAGNGHGLVTARVTPDLPFFMRVIGRLGGGEVPLSIVAMLLFFSWGTVGFVTNQVLRPVMPRPWMVGLCSLPLAAVGSVVLTRGIARAVARWLPTNQTFARRKSDLVGSLGEAVFFIDRGSGTASVRDRQGDLFQVSCRTYEDGPPIEKGKQVLLVDYNPQQNIFYVTESRL